MRLGIFRCTTIMTTLLLAACVTNSQEPRTVSAEQPGGETIRLSVGPCFGFCPVYDASVTPDGRIFFDGKRHTAVLGKRSLQGGPALYRELAKELLPYRPTTAAETAIDCSAAVSDTSTFTVTWTDMEGAARSAKVESGCPGGPGAVLVKTLRTMPMRLGVADWAKQTTRPDTPRG